MITTILVVIIAAATVFSVVSVIFILCVAEMNSDLQKLRGLCLKHIKIIIIIFSIVFVLVVISAFQNIHSNAATALMWHL